MQIRKMSKIIMSVSFLLLFLSLPTIANAKDKVYQGYTYCDYYNGEYEDEDLPKGVVITSYKGTDTTLAIPEMIDGKKVLRVEFPGFNNNTNLEKIILPQYVREIYYSDPNEEPDYDEYYAPIIAGCPNLKSIEVADANQHLTDKDGILYSADMTELCYCPPGKAGDIVIPDTVKKIGFCAFYGCANITSTLIPKSVEYISFTAFGENDKLATIGVEAENKNYKSVENVVFDKIGEELCIYSTGNKNTQYTIPEGVITIQMGAFSKNNTLKNVITPATLDTIEMDAFSDCLALENVVFQKGLRSIGEGAFCQCSNLTSVIFSEGIREVNDYAFLRCNKLKNVILPSSIVKVSRELLVGANRTVKVYSMVLKTEMDELFQKKDKKLVNYILYAYQDSDIYEEAKAHDLPVKKLKNKKDDAVSVKQIKTSSKVKKGTGKPNTKWYSANKKVYRLSTPDQIAGLAKLVNSSISFKGKKILLTKDLDLKCYKDWTPIGRFNKSGWKDFNGVFDGQGHTIYNLTTNDLMKDDQALFGGTGKSATIKNLNIKGANIKGDSHSAILVSVNEGNIYSCIIHGAVNGDYETGGIVASSIQGKISNCTFIGKIKGDNIVGGIIGISFSRVIKCINRGTIIGNTEVGGISGEISESWIDNCSNQGKIIGDAQVGGMCGSISYEAEITGGKNSGAITGNKYVGGVVGIFDTGGKVKNVVNKGKVKGTIYVGGITGSISSDYIEKCKNQASVTGTSRVGGIIGQIDKLSTDEKNYRGCKNSGKVNGKYKTGDIYGEKLYYSNY